MWWRNTFRRKSVEEQWDLEGLERALVAEFASTQPIRGWLDARRVTQ